MLTAGSDVREVFHSRVSFWKDKTPLTKVPASRPWSSQSLQTDSVMLPVCFNRTETTVCPPPLPAPLRVLSASSFIRKEHTLCLWLAINTNPPSSIQERLLAALQLTPMALKWPPDPTPSPSLFICHHLPICWPVASPLSICLTFLLVAADGILWSCVWNRQQREICFKRWNTKT